MSSKDQMTHRERVFAALKGEEEDRLPCCVWGHYPEVDQDPIHNAETMLQIAVDHDFDWIKVSPDQYAFMQDWGLSVEHFGSPDRKTAARRSLIRSPEDWKGMRVLSAEHGMWGKTADLNRYMDRFQKERGVDIPYLVTINSPFTTLAELGGVQQTLEHMRAYPEVIREALQKVTDTTINYMQEAMKLDLGGFFFTSRYCSSDYMSLEEYRVFGEYYDRQLFRVFEGKTGFNMNHIHGANTYWDFLAQYPFECVNWHDTWIPPTLEDARRKTEKCLCGGLSEKEMLPFGTPEQIKAQIRDVVRRAGARGLMITNGCGTFPTPSFANMQAVTDGVRELELAF